MTEGPKANPEEDSTAKSTGSVHDSGWQEVGRQFEALGQSLAEAMRAAWENEETQRRVQEMRVGLESMAREVGKAVEDTANSPKGQQVRQNAERTAESLRTATEQTIQEVRPQLITALQQLNEELQKLINRMGQKSGPSAGGSSSGVDNDPTKPI